MNMPHSGGKIFPTLSIAAATLWFTCNHAAAEMDASTFLQNYDRADATGRHLYERVLGATENGLSWANSALSHDHHQRLYCAPGKLAITDEQDVDILRRHVKEHPEHQTAPYGLVLLLALELTFPCPKQ